MNELEFKRLLENIAFNKIHDLDLSTASLIKQTAGSNKKDNSQMTRLLTALEKNTSLNNVNLSGHDITTPGSLAIFVQHSAPLEKHRQIENFNLARTKLDDSAFKQICYAFRQNKNHFGTVDLTGNNITPIGAKELGHALQSSNNISELILNSNKLGPAGIKNIVDGMLKKVQRIETLKVANNDLGDAGAIEIAKIIEHNDHLLEIDLSYNKITDKGALHIAQALRNNSKIVGINLEKNDISDTAAKPLLAVLKFLPNLKKVNLDSNRLSFEVKESLNNYMESQDNKKGISTGKRPNFELNNPKYQKALEDGVDIPGILFFKTDLIKLIFNESRNYGISLQHIKSPSDLRRAINKEIYSGDYDKVILEHLFYLISKTELLAEGYPKDFYDKLNSIRKLNTPENKILISQFVTNLLPEYKKLIAEGKVLGTEIELQIASKVMDVRFDIYQNDNFSKHIGNEFQPCLINLEKDKYQYGPYISTRFSENNHSAIFHSTKIISALKEFIEREVIPKIERLIKHSNAEQSKRIDAIVAKIVPKKPLLFTKQEDITSDKQLPEEDNLEKNKPNL